MNNNDITNSKIVEAMTKLEEAMAILNQVREGIPTSEHTVMEITKYISGSSGNETWRGECLDKSTVYFRQLQKKLFQDCGIWSWLNDLDLDSTYAVEIEIKTIPDGNFLKIVEVGEHRIYGGVIN